MIAMGNLCSLAMHRMIPFPNWKTYSKPNPNIRFLEIWKVICVSFNGDDRKVKPPSITSSVSTLKWMGLKKQTSSSQLGKLALNNRNLYGSFD